ncbi:hypothetical protein [Metabacillus sediminilitoris]|uniref:Uncharacterized protein n=1 Tax=Metabacillus sediminilitoris TaxID=2567941 RepID=A0A4S4C0D0_9BACI|nr:hypothetical protein [Metabacillus sediminilitoris]QGQ44720.1 hypothetical protein GMB29_05210 [Metabacillus sediminilitoris]THF78932.1 hypothetical protein E6W99_14520 [Metabacillus sediminilitoris]
MAIFRTGPFLVPSQTQNGSPINTVVVMLTNQTQRTLNAVFKINQVALNPQPLPPSGSPITVLHPPQRVRLQPNQAKSFAVPIDEQSETISITQSNPGSTALIVTVRGDVAGNGRGIIASVTGGFAAPGESLTISEPTMQIRHDEFVKVPIRKRK